MTPGKSGTGRLIFALDATMSRQPTWDMACALQGDMFREAGSIGGLSVRLIYYRGLNECRASGWISDTAHLARLMSRIECQGGQTQLGTRAVRRAPRGGRFRSAVPSCSSVMRWRKISMLSAPRRANSACSRCLASCFRRGTIGCGSGVP